MSICARCGAAFSCAVADGSDAPCWCMQMPAGLPVPEEGAGAGCWCPHCLKLAIDAKQGSAEPPAHD